VSERVRKRKRERERERERESERESAGERKSKRKKCVMTTCGVRVKEEGREGGENRHSMSNVCELRVESSMCVRKRFRSLSMFVRKRFRKSLRDFFLSEKNVCEKEVQDSFSQTHNLSVLNIQLL